ncbi:hypothetical protein EDB89DRAFT_2152141 [Lactarius sanguifluus]|nr:hypothetical protein EDB89DRAFT_2152141 [Lactarius sanguifluus]
MQQLITNILRLILSTPPRMTGQHQHSLVPVPSGNSHYAQSPIPPILPSSSSSELSYALVETPPPESRPINHSSIALPNLPMPSSPALFETLVELTPVKTEYASDIDGQPLLPMTSLSTFLLSRELASHPKEGGQEDAHVFPTPAGTHGHPHHRPHANDLFCLQDPAMYLGHISPPPFKRRPPPPSLAILGQLAYSPGARNPTPHSLSLSSSDIGMPTSNSHVATAAASHTSTRGPPLPRMRGSPHASPPLPPILPRESPASVPCRHDTQDPPLHQPAAHKPRQTYALNRPQCPLLTPLPQTPPDILSPPIASYSLSPMVSFGLSLVSSVSPPVIPSPPRPYPGGLSFSPHFTSIFGIATNASRRSQPSDRFILLISQYGFIRSLASIFSITSRHSQPSDHFIPLLALSQRPLAQPLPHQRRRHRSLRQSSLVEAYFPQGHSIQTRKSTAQPLFSLATSLTSPSHSRSPTARHPHLLAALLTPLRPPLALLAHPQPHTPIFSPPSHELSPPLTHPRSLYPHPPSPSFALPCPPPPSLALARSPLPALARPCSPLPALARPCSPLLTLALPCPPSLALARPHLPLPALAHLCPRSPSLARSRPRSPSLPVLSLPLSLARPLPPLPALSLNNNNSTNRCLKTPAGVVPTTFQPCGFTDSIARWGRQDETRYRSTSLLWTNHTLPTFLDIGLHQ